MKRWSITRCNITFTGTAEEQMKSVFLLDYSLQEIAGANKHIRNHQVHTYETKPGFYVLYRHHKILRNFRQQLETGGTVRLRISAIVIMLQ